MGEVNGSIPSTIDQQAWSSGRPRVMVVGGHQALAVSAGELLAGSSDAVILHAHNGEDALEKLGQIVPDLILTDITMPGMDGFELCRRIKQDGRFEQIPLVFVTTRAQQGDVLRGFAEGGADYIHEPISPDELLIRVSAHLTVSLQLRQVLSEMSGRVEQAERLAVQASHIKENFLARMSHELRTPLTTIIGNGEILAEKLRNTEDESVIRAVIHAGQCQLALVNDMLDLSRIESGQMAIEERPYNLNELFQEVDAMYRLRMRDVGLEWVVDQQHWEKYLLLGDVQRIKQILANLLGNALKFTDTGRVTMRLQRHEEQLILTVEDSGIGMSPETIEQLFQRFEQADGSIRRRFGGSGLGLSISQYLAELMGGTIDVSSRLGEGATFRLILPYRPSSEPAPAREQEPVNNNHDIRYHGKVLVVEDTPALQLLECRILQKMGIETATASNGEAAVASAGRENFDLILMDMQMPIMDGIEATRRLRAQGVHTPIVALTANVMQHHRDAFFQAGCDGFLAKPIDRNALRQILARYLNPDREPSQQEVQEAAVEKSGWRVLAVDDEPDVLSYYQTLLAPKKIIDWSELGVDDETDEETLPLRLDIAGSGEDGVRMLEASIAGGDPYSVILLDMRMPGGLDGLETASRIRSIDSESKIVFITAYMDYSLSDIRQQIGLNFEFLQKPARPEELIQLVLSLASSWGQYRELLRAHNLLKHSSVGIL